MNLIVYVLFEDFIIVISKLIHAALIICKYGCQLAAIVPTMHVPPKMNSKCGFTQ